MQAEPSNVIALTEVRERHEERALARRLFFETERHSRRLPTLPRFGTPAAVVIEDGHRLVLLVRPDLDDIDLKIVAYALAMKSLRSPIDTAEAVRLDTILGCRATLERDARAAELSTGAYVYRELLGVEHPRE